MCAGSPVCRAEAGQAPEVLSHPAARLPPEDALDESLEKQPAQGTAASPATPAGRVSFH